VHSRQLATINWERSLGAHTPLLAAGSLINKQEDFSAMTIRVKFILTVTGIILLSYLFLSFLQVQSGRETTNKRLLEVLSGYEHITKALFQSHSKFLAQQSGIISKDRELIALVKCSANIDSGKYKCAKKIIPESILSEYPDKTVNYIVSNRAGFKEEVKALLRKKIEENSIAPLNQLRSSNPDINKLYFSFQNIAIFRSFSSAHGDSIKSPMVEYSATEKKGVSGIEMNEGEPGYFQTIPVFFPKNYIISAYGIPLSAILRDIQDVTQVDHIAFINEDHKVYYNMSRKGVAALDPSILDVTRFESFFEKGKQGLFYVPVNDFADKVIGKVALVKNIDNMLNEERAALIQLSLVLIITTVIIIAIIVMLFTALVNKPLKEMGAMIHDIAKGEGDLTRRLEVKSKDEIGDVAQGFNSFVDKLHNLIMRIADVTSKLADSSDQLAKTSIKFTEGAESQTDQMAQIATAIEEMSLSVTEVARNTSDTSTSSREAKEIALKGGEVVSGVVNGMMGLQTTVKESAATITRLGEGSEHIVEIINVINDIADQTNLLALNAAIEAARAGEKGRGFAVVADEVRKLADRTTKATKEIALMIRNLQTGTHGAVSSMEKGTEEVAREVELVDKAGVALKDILGMVNEVTDKVDQIAAATEEQSATAAQIAGNTTSASSVANTLAESAKESLLATEELNRLSIDLKSIVGEFKLH